MPTSLNKYLDPAGLDETVVNIRELIEGLEAEMQDLPYARPDGLYPEMTVGAVIGADETSQWAQRECSSTGTAIVRSVQGASEVINDELVPVHIAGIATTDAQSGELDRVEWETQTLRAAGSSRDELTAGELVTRVGVVDLGTLTWSNPNPGVFNAIISDMSLAVTNKVVCAPYSYATNNFNWANINSYADKSISTASNAYIYVKDTAYTSAVAFKAAMTGVLCFYALATPTTTPIRPALPMTYRTQAGGSESVIVPSGEVSAAPLLTVAEPVNAGDEFSRIWAAIESLGYTRNTAQLSRPVSLADAGTVDETQKDTAEIAEIETTKEVQK